MVGEFKPHWNEDDEGNLEFIPFEISDPDGGSSIPIDLSEDELKAIGIDISTAEGRDALAVLLKDVLNRALKESKETQIQPKGDAK